MSNTTGGGGSGGDERQLRRGRLQGTNRRIAAASACRLVAWVCLIFFAIAIIIIRIRIHSVKHEFHSSRWIDIWHTCTQRVYYYNSWNAICPCSSSSVSAGPSSAKKDVRTVLVDVSWVQKVGSFQSVLRTVFIASPDNVEIAFWGQKIYRFMVGRLAFAKEIGIVRKCNCVVTCACAGVCKCFVLLFLCVHEKKALGKIRNFF